MRASAQLAAARDLDVLITGGSIIDGTGAPPFRGDVGVRGDRIVAVSRERLARARAVQVIEADGKIVAPGFIDLHVHIERLLQFPAAENYVRQGVTLVVGNPDGGWLPHRPSPWPLDIYLREVERTPLGINVAYLVGHNSVRREVMGMANRPPSEADLSKMRSLVKRAMGNGVFGLSVGPNYVPGAYSTTSEVVSLARAAAESGGIVTSHIRDEGAGLLGSVAEMIDVGRQAGLSVVIDHHKALGSNVWGSSVQTLRMIDSAREAGVNVAMNIYPYTAAATSVSSMVPAWALADGDEAMTRRFRAEDSRQQVQAGIAEYIKDRAKGELQRIQFARVPWEPGLQGKTLKDWAIARNMEPTPNSGAALVIEALLNGGATAVFHLIDEDDVKRIMKHRMTMIASDGELTKPGDAQLHPRSYGTFPRVLRRYVNEEKILQPEEAIRKMTSLPASTLGLTDRGRIAEHAAADLVIYDPKNIADRATFTEPHQYADGIEWVLVNGRVGVQSGKLTTERSGRLIKRPAFQ
jgi:dihydroorotase/N-acyl-D-amino-acid deacylase